MVFLLILEWSILLAGAVGGFLMARKLINRALIIHYECKKGTGHGWFLHGYWQHVRHREDYDRFLRLLEAGRIPSMDDLELDVATLPTVENNETCLEMGGMPGREVE